MHVLLAPIALACHLCLPSDTPPSRIIAPPVVGELRTREDVVGASRKADGSAVPLTIVLPVLRNRADLIAYIRSNFPESSQRFSAMPVLWVYVDDAGGAYPHRVMKSAGEDALDSLAVAVVRRARFQPALLEKARLAVWVPLPVALERRPSDETPQFTPYTTKPELLNRNEVSVALVRNYPPALRDAGQGGTTLMWVRLNVRGEVEVARMKESSGFPELDAAAERVARVMRFTPARNHGEPVPVWIQLPIVFAAGKR